MRISQDRVTPPLERASQEATGPHDPTIVERLACAHDSMTIARFVARYGLETSLARKELARARMELTRVIRILEHMRTGDGRPEIDEMLARSRDLCRDLRSITAEISSLN